MLPEDVEGDWDLWGAEVTRKSLCRTDWLSEVIDVESAETACLAKGKWDRRH